jgi:hypothetical protein
VAFWLRTAATTAGVLFHLPRLFLDVGHGLPHGRHADVVAWKYGIETRGRRLEELPEPTRA